MLETIVEQDEDGMEAYLEGTSPIETLKALIARVLSMASSRFVAVGVQEQGRADAVSTRVLTIFRPAEVPAIKGSDVRTEKRRRVLVDDEPFSLLAFKIMRSSVGCSRLRGCTPALSRVVRVNSVRQDGKIGRMR